MDCGAAGFGKPRLCQSSALTGEAGGKTEYPITRPLYDHPCYLYRILRVDWAVATGDASRFKTYFPSLRVVSP